MTLPLANADPAKHAQVVIGSPEPGTERTPIDRHAFGEFVSSVVRGPDRAPGRAPPADAGQPQ